MSTNTHKGGRPARGQLIWKEGLGWYGRFYATVDGERVRVCRALHTDHKPTARRKLARLIAEGQTSSDEARRPETFEEAARRVVEQQQVGGMSTWKDRLTRLETYTFKRLGKLTPSAIKASHVRGVLEEARDKGKARQTITNIKNDISAVLGDLWRAELLPENVCARVKIPEAQAEATERSKKERAVLTDDELVRYLGWEHPEEHFRMAALERQVMACVARCFGGLRTSDLHVIRWEGFDLPDFTWGIAPRKKGSGRAKGGKPQRLVVPEVLRAILGDWWERQGRPTEGLVFPKRRGDGAGKAERQNVSHAARFREDLRRMFGIDQLEAVEAVRKNGRKLTKRVWKKNVRPMTPRERMLFEETPYSLPVDFHSWRRAYNQGLADAGVNAQQAKGLAGHSTMEAHERYLRNTTKLLTVPVEALPVITIGHTAMGTLREQPRIVANTPPSNDAETASIMLAASGDEACKTAIRGFESHPRLDKNSRSVDRARSQWAHGKPTHWRAVPRWALAALPAQHVPAGVAVRLARLGGAELGRSS